MSWYAIRTVYQFGTKNDGTNVFEERVVVFEAESWEEAHAKGEAESDDSATQNDLTAYSERSGYLQDGEPFVDGYEVWSELFEDKSELEAFYLKRYGQYEYKPDAPDA